MVASRSGRFARALTDALCLYVIPLSAALLPWRWGFAWLKRLSVISFLHRDSVASLWAGAAPFFPGADAREWQRRARLLLLVEHTDAWLTLLRSDRWWRRNVRIDGAFPAPDRANLLLTYHWGAGNWIWRVLRAHGIGAWFLARRPHGRSLGMTRLSHLYARWRSFSLRRIGSSGIIFTGDSADAIRQALAAKESIVGMLDLGVREGQRAAAGTLLGRPVRLPFGLARIAQEAGAGIALFSVGLDWRSGTRDLRIETLPGSDAAAAMAAYIRHLDARLRAAPEAWQMWHEAHAIFMPRGEQHGDALPSISASAD
jgi:hypothetical protein